MLAVQVARFAAELAEFAATLPRVELASPLAAIAQRLPPLARGQTWVRPTGPLAEALGSTASLLAETREAGDAPRRFVVRLESHLTRLYGVGAGLPRHQQRPHPAAPLAPRGQRATRRCPAPRVAAFG